MSNTYRRKKFNSKRRFFYYYWTVFSKEDVEKADYIEKWKYHSDNYYNKSKKSIKQFYKNKDYKKLRQIFVKELKSYNNIDDFFLERKSKKSIKRDIY
jgi:hypothetical protein